jgi:hypothetical protein
MQRTRRGDVVMTRAVSDPTTAAAAADAAELAAAADAAEAQAVGLCRLNQVDP